MNIVLLTGSAHRSGTTATLAREVQRGAEDAGHEVFRFDAAFKDVHPCIGCDKCVRTSECTFEADDMKELNRTSPRPVIDRFYANNEALMGKKKAVFLTAMAAEDQKTASGANASFDLMADYLGWEIVGRLNVGGCSTADDLHEEDLTAAYELGKNL